MERRGQPPVARGYFTGPAWRDRYFQDIYRPFMRAAAAPQGLSTAVARLSPLFAARENLTFITNAVVVPGSRQFQSYARMSHSVMRQHGLIQPGWDFDRVQRHVLAGNNVNDFARSRGGPTGILLTHWVDLHVEGSGAGPEVANSLCKWKEP